MIVVVIVDEHRRQLKTVPTSFSDLVEQALEVFQPCLASLAGKINFQVRHNAGALFRCCLPDGEVSIWMRFDSRLYFFVSGSMKTVIRLQSLQVWMRFLDFTLSTVQ